MVDTDKKKHYNVTSCLILIMKRAAGIRKKQPAGRSTQEDIMRLKKFVPILLSAVLGFSALAGCGSAIDGDKTGATFDGKEISLGLMNFMARYQQIIYDMYFGPDVWGQDMSGDGTTMEENVKSEVVENIKTLYMLEKHMADYNVEITDDELAKIEEAAKKFMEDNTDKAIKQVGATEEYVKEMLRLNTIQIKMQKAIEAEVDTEVSDEEAAQKKISYVQVNKSSKTDEEGNTVDYTEEEKAALQTDVETFAASAASDFEGAAETAGYTVSTATYGTDNSTLAEEVTEAADKLKEGEISSVITTDDSYYVVRMDSLFDEEATESRKSEIVEERKSDHYTEVCDGYKKDVPFELNEDEWAKVKFDEFFTMKQAETEGTEDTTGEESTEGAEDAAGTEDTADGENTESTDNAGDTADGADGAEDVTGTNDADSVAE